MAKPIVCRECGEPRRWQDFLDDEGKVSSRCVQCREAVKTPRETPASRRASGKIDVRQLQEVLRQQKRDSLRPPPETPPPSVPPKKKGES